MSEEAHTSRRLSCFMALIVLPALCAGCALTKVPKRSTNASSSDLVVRGQMPDMLRATIVLMNRELELLIREVMIQMALRKQSLQGDRKPP